MYNITGQNSSNRMRPECYELINFFYKGMLDFAIEDLSWDDQDFFLKATVQNDLLCKYPMNNKFSQLFFKKLITILEQNNNEVHDGLYEYLCSVMKLPPSEFCYRHYIIKDDINNFIIIKETDKMVINGTTGMRTWEAAFMLADWALCNKYLLKNKKVLELGSGVGFTGICIAKYCDVDSVIMTDFHDDVLRLIQENININFSLLNNEKYNDNTDVHQLSKTILNVEKLDWRNLEDSLDIIPDVLIGADIVYDPSILKPLCDVFKKFIQRNNQLEIYIASMIRNEETFELFIESLDHEWLTWERINHEKVYFDWNEMSSKQCLLKICKRI